MNYFIKEEIIPYKKITLPKVDKKGIQIYSDSDLQKLLAKPKRNASFTTYKSWVIVNLLLSVGIRQNSLIHLKTKDIDFDNSVLNVRVTKNHKLLILPLNEDIINILYHYLKRRNGNQDDYLFCNVYGEKLCKSTLYHQIQDYNKLCGVEITGLHRYRHTFATKYIQNGGNVVTLSKILGHSSILITQNYINTLMSDLRQDIEKTNIIRQFKGRKAIR